MKRRKRTAVIRCAGGGAVRPPQAGGESADCAARMTLPPGEGGCGEGCLGGGSCLAVCPREAISFRENGSAAVDRGKCIGCGKCVRVCPRGLIALVPAENTIQPLCSSTLPGRETRLACGAGCIGCGICERACPAGAIRVEENRAVIDQEKCIACGMCAAKCPRGVIHDANGIISDV